MVQILLQFRIQFIGHGHLLGLVCCLAPIHHVILVMIQEHHHQGKFMHQHALLVQ